MDGVRHAPWLGPLLRRKRWWRSSCPNVRRSLPRPPVDPPSPRHDRRPSKGRTPRERPDRAHRLRNFASAGMSISTLKVRMHTIAPSSSARKLPATRQVPGAVQRSPTFPHRPRLHPNRPQALEAEGMISVRSRGAIPGRIARTVRTRRAGHDEAIPPARVRGPRIPSSSTAPFLTGCRRSAWFFASFTAMGGNAGPPLSHCVTG